MGAPGPAAWRRRAAGRPSSRCCWSRRWASVWHPAPEPCAAAPDPRQAIGAPAGAAWAPPGATPPRAATVADFDRACAYRVLGPGQIIYGLFTACKWPDVDPALPLVQASGTLREINLSAEDSPWIHTSQDLGLEMALDPGQNWLTLGGPPGAIQHMETESGHFPLPYRPVAGDRLTVAGRWIYDCGHDPKTEIHPLAMVAGEHDEWRADVAAPRRLPAWRASG